MASSPEARPLAGGQSLVPAMNFRLARPAMLVDLGRIAALRGLRVEQDGSVIAGGMTRHRDFEMSDEVRRRLPLVHAAMPGIAHPAIRSRGTIGGSLAHADPAADWPALVLACDAEVTLASPSGTRTVAADAFLKDVFETALRPGELLTAVRFPAWTASRRWGLQKHSRRRGDFAIVGVACTVDLDGGRCARARVAIYGAGSRAVLAPSCMHFLEGKTPSDVVLGEAARLAAGEVGVRGDLHASAEYRTELVGALVRRALDQAFHG